MYTQTQDHLLKEHNIFPHSNEYKSCPVCYRHVPKKKIHQRYASMYNLYIYYFKKLTLFTWIAISTAASLEENFVNLLLTPLPLSPQAQH